MLINCKEVRQHDADQAGLWRREFISPAARDMQVYYDPPKTQRRRHDPRRGQVSRGRQPHRRGPFTPRSETTRPPRSRSRDTSRSRSRSRGRDEPRHEGPRRSRSYSPRRRYPSRSPSASRANAMRNVSYDRSPMPGVMQLHWSKRRAQTMRSSSLGDTRDRGQRHRFRRSGSRERGSMERGRHHQKQRRGGYSSCPPPRRRSRSRSQERRRQPDARSSTSPASRKQAQICRNFANGFCKFGANCKYSHASTAPQVKRRNSRPASPARQRSRSFVVTGPTTVEREQQSRANTTSAPPSDSEMSDHAGSEDGECYQIEGKEHSDWHNSTK